MTMDTKFIGTWELDNSQTQGMEDLAKVMGFTEEQTKLYSSLSYSFTLKQDGDSYKLEVDFRGKLPNTSYTIKEGETIDYTSADGRKSKLTLTVEGGSPSESYEIPDTPAKWVVKRTVEGDVMTSVTTMGGANMTQKFKRT